MEDSTVWEWGSTDETIILVCMQLYFLNYNPMLWDQFSGLCFAMCFVARPVHGQIVTEAIGMRILVSGSLFNIQVTYSWNGNSVHLFFPLIPTIVAKQHPNKPVERRIVKAWDILITEGVQVNCIISIHPALSDRKWLHKIITLLFLNCLLRCSLQISDCMLLHFVKVFCLWMWVRPSVSQFENWRVFGLVLGEWEFSHRLWELGPSGAGRSLLCSTVPCAALLPLLLPWKFSLAASQFLKIFCSI